MKICVAVAASLSLLVAAPAFAGGQCKDARGRFVKCPATGAKSAMAGGVVKDAKGKCHIASGPRKGQFTKCP